jgi:hypothetical protein
MQFEVAVAGWVFNSYVTKEFVLGPHTIKVMCLQASSTDFDLTGQLIWPGAELLNNYLVQNFHILQGLSVIELGSGVGELHKFSSWILSGVQGIQTIGVVWFTNSFAVGVHFALLRLGLINFGLHVCG